MKPKFDRTNTFVAEAREWGIGRTNRALRAEIDRVEALDPPDPSADDAEEVHHRRTTRISVLEAMLTERIDVAANIRDGQGAAGLDLNKTESQHIQSAVASASAPSTSPPA